MLLLMLMLACGGSAPQPCTQEDPGARDACLAEGVQQWLERDEPAKAEGMLRQMAPGEARDLAWMAYARKTTLPVCGEIQDAGLQEHCRTLVGRMHMRGTEEAAATASKAKGELLGCPPEGMARERCLEERALGASTVAEAEGFCRAMGSGDGDGECRVNVAQHAGEEGRLSVGLGLCAGITAQRWQSECWFRFSEVADSAPVEKRVAWCDKSDHYADQCRVHLLDQVARSLVSSSSGGSVEAAVAAAKARWTELDRAGLGQGRGGDREGLYWAQVSHQLLRLSVGPGRPAAAHMSWTALLPEERRRDFRDLVLRSWLQTEASGLSLGAENPLSELLQRFAEQTGADLKETLPERSTEDDRGHHQATLGRLPWPFAPAARCTMTEAERDRIALLWGASSLDHALAFVVLRAGASDEAPLVRAFALSAIEDRVFEWDRGGELGWGDLAEVLGERAAAEEVPLIRERAVALVDALVLRQPLDPLQGFGLCDPVKEARRRPQ